MGVLQVSSAKRTGRALRRLRVTSSRSNLLKRFFWRYKTESGANNRFSVLSFVGNVPLKAGIFAVFRFWSNLLGAWALRIAWRIFVVVTEGSSSSLASRPGQQRMKPNNLVWNGGMNDSCRLERLVTKITLLFTYRLSNAAPVAQRLWTVTPKYCRNKLNHLDWAWNCLAPHIAADWPGIFPTPWSEKDKSESETDAALSAWCQISVTFKFLALINGHLSHLDKSGFVAEKGSRIFEVLEELNPMDWRKPGVISSVRQRVRRVFVWWHTKHQHPFTSLAAGTGSISARLFWNKRGTQSSRSIGASCEPWNTETLAKLEPWSCRTLEAGTLKVVNRLAPRDP